MSIKFKCKKEDFKSIEYILMYQEYKEKPEFDNIIISMDEDEEIKYYYKLENLNNTWYIVTEEK